MAALYEFRDTSFYRKHRLQLIEDSFARGMQYTNTPLLEGYVKTLVNFDMQDSGASLVPRLGLRGTKVLTPEEVTDETCTGAEQIVAAKEQNVDQHSMPQFFLGHALTGTPIGDMHVGRLTMLTGNTEPDNSYPIPAEKYVQATYDTAAYVLPQNAEIHGIALGSTDVLTRHVGTYGWVKRYYFFDPVEKKLVHSMWNDDTKAFEFVVEEPKDINSNTAVTWGYNMLKENPYTFSNSFSASGGIIDFDGILPYNVDGTLNLTPVTNESLEFKLFYSVPQGKKYHIVWEWRSTATDTWTTLKEQDYQFDELLNMSLAFAPPDSAIIIRVSAYGYTENDKQEWVRNTYTDATLAVGFNFNKAEYGATVNADNKTYTIAHCTGMTYWKNRLVVWGVPEDQTLLFASDVNDPTYFPYPNNCETFDEPIKYAVVFMDYLLVFTSTQLYMLTLTEDGLGWSTQCIQNNLTIADWDLHLIQVVKNMVFFRSGNYYYMIVPKSGSLSGELQLAAVSKPMYYFFDNFEQNVKDILYDVYDYDGSLVLQHYYNYLDFEDVHNVYVFQTNKSEYINFCVLYNTTDRSWRIYVFGSQSVRTPYKADATRRGTLCSLASAAHTADQTVAIPELFRFDVKRDDWYVPRLHTVDTIQEVFNSVHVFKNWQSLDMGYREHNSNFKKRYREIQFVLNNISNQALEFYTDFFIDGEQRKNRHSYVITQDKDPGSSKYGVITVEKVLSDPVVAPSTTLLGADDNDYEAWVLDTSRFPEVAFWKVRQPVSGKGYAPRFCFTSRNEDLYELLNVSFVYRALGSR